MTKRVPVAQQATASGTQLSTGASGHRAVQSQMQEPSKVKQKCGWKTDPRTKLLLILITALATFFAPGLWFEIVLVLCAVLYGIASGKSIYPLTMLAIYALTLAVMLATSFLDAGIIKTMLSSFFLLLRKVFPCAVLAGVVVSTTKVGEFMTAMARMRISRQITIPLTVMLRYVPTVREDWGFVRDAMKMRGISPSPLGLVRKPARTIECIYVPLMMSALNASDDLSMAAIARGIENPEPRSCFTPISFGPFDIVSVGIGIALLICAICLQAGIL